jgi:TIR domain
VDALISHSSKNRTVATRLEKALEGTGLRVWLDDSEIRLGVLLGKELQEAIRASRVLILLWSKDAATSRWVASEWVTAFHMNRFIVPTVLDDTPLPQCLQSSVFLPMRRVGTTVVERLSRAVREAPDGANPLAPLIRSEASEVKQTIAGIAGGQQAFGEQLLKRELDRAAELQVLLDDVMEKALQAWPLDPMIVNLAGYHLKNAYMLKHWDAIQAGRAPDDSLLAQAERRFFETLSINPIDPSALNGLGSILTFRRDLEAAEFFILTAIDQAKHQKLNYPAAEHDLALVRRYKRG